MARRSSGIRAMSTSTIQNVAQTVTQTGAATAIVAGGLNLSEYLAIGGFAIALVGLVFSVWFSFKYRRP